MLEQLSGETLLWAPVSQGLGFCGAGGCAKAAVATVRSEIAANAAGRNDVRSSLLNLLKPPLFLPAANIQKIGNAGHVRGCSSIRIATANVRETTTRGSSMRGKSKAQTQIAPAPVWTPLIPATMPRSRSRRSATTRLWSSGNACRAGGSLCVSCVK